MAKKPTVGGVSTLAAALQSAGVVPTTPASADETVIATPAPSSADAAVAASAELAEEISAAKKAWEHAKASGITKEQFLRFCEIDPSKSQFILANKKAIFGGKKKQLEEAAQDVINVNRTASDAKKSKKTKKNLAKPPIEKRALKTSRLINKTIAETIGLRLI